MICVVYKFFVTNSWLPSVRQFLILKLLFLRLKKNTNLLKHLQIQEENYSVTLKNYENKLDQLLKQKDEEIDKLLREKCCLEATILGEEVPVLL